MSLSNDSDDIDYISQAYLEFFNLISDKTIDNVQLFEDSIRLYNILTKVSPQYFDPTTLAPSPGTNWPLRLSNLKKLLSNLEGYYRHELLMDTPKLRGLQLDQIAKSSSLPSLHTLLSLVVVALISCPDKATYIQPIMSLSPSNQAALKSVIEATMGTVEKVIPERRDSLESEGEEVDFTLDPSEVADLRSQVSQLTGELSRVKNDLEVVRVKDEGRVEEAERHNEKLKGLVEDLQGRLEENEQKLSTTTTSLTQLKSTHTALLDTYSTLQSTSKSSLDELEILRSKSLQLTKTEAQLSKAKLRVEEMESVVVRVSESERRGAEYLDRILKLEGENKKLPEAQRKLEGARTKQNNAEDGRREAEMELKSKVLLVEQLKAQLQTASTTSKMFETELLNFRETSRSEVGDEETKSGKDGGNEEMGSGETKEMIARLEFENSNLKKQVASQADGGEKEERIEEAERKCRRAEEDAKKAREELEVQRKEAEVSNVALAKLDSNSKAALAKVESDSKGGMEKLQSEIKELTGKNETHEGQAKSLQEAISKLTTSLKTADASITKLKGDRSNIEVYTKQTLHKFQEKYLVALQGCRQKLKDERARNEQLEERLQRDKASQKREERLLSASVYELGLRILSERAQKR